MNSLRQIETAQIIRYLSIEDHNLKEIIPDGDLFIGRKQSFFMTLEKCMTLRFRDIVVLGELIVKPDDPTCPWEAMPTLSGRHCILLPHSSIDVKFSVVTLWQPQDPSEFKTKLQDIILYQTHRLHLRN